MPALVWGVQMVLCTLAGFAVDFIAAPVLKPLNILNIISKRKII
jgi:hypothetical protein